MFFDYLFEYSWGHKRKVDIIIAHLVDYDWPIGDGKPTITPISDQIRVMEQVMVLTGGRLHCFAPFDPMKEVAFQLGVTDVSPLNLVKDAIANRGFVGVKLYPPMGFAPIGNDRVQQALPGFWNKPWMRPELLRPDLGQRLDAALSSLYDWCLRNNVPLMAHTAPSNGPDATFEDLTDANNWKQLPPGLRVNFGHFGETDEVENGTTRAKAFADLMTPDPGSLGEIFYADPGYFAASLTEPVQLTSRLRKLFRDTSRKGTAALANRLMYGTDWEMIVMEGAESDQYLSRFEQIFANLDADIALGAEGPLSNRFFGVNAANYLGLRKEGAAPSNRARLEAFYGRHQVPQPMWIKKVDAILG
ncbi:Amidohydrolase [Rhizobiales bacterium GAS191]|nr:Amidohydrolase [Rhizobiales bacterium GAS191]